MIEKDTPITTVEQDILGRDSFAKKLADIIAEENNLDSNGFVIGIQGAWGCGKTSLCNLLRAHIEKQNRTNQEIIIGNVNAWMVSNREMLIQSFFKQLSDILSSKIFNISKQEIKNYIRGLLSTSEISLGIRETNITLKPFYNLADISVQKQKEDIAKEIGQAGGKVVFFIDDIDRLTDSEIATVFWLVKNIADFPNVIYVLCYDVTIVTAALNKVQQNHGMAYLEKIVQIPINVPMPGKDKVYRYFFDKLKKICVKNNGHEIIDWEYIDSLYHAGMRDVLSTIRDCNRLLNAFSFKYILCRNEVDVGDLLVITAFELYANEIYELLRRNMSALNRKSYYETASTQKETEGFAKIIDAVIDKYRSDGIDIKLEKETIHSLMGVIFPKFSLVVKWFAPNKASYTPQQMHRIQCEKYFFRYFELSIDENDVPAERVYNFVYHDDLRTMQEFLKQCIDQGRVNSLFRQLDEGFYSKDNADVWTELSIVRIEALLMALLKVNNFSIDKNELINRETYWSWNIVRILQYMKRNFKDSEIGGCLSKIVTEESICFSNVSKLVLEIYVGYKYPNNVEHHYTVWESYVSESVKNNIEKVFMERLSVCLSDDAVINEKVSGRMVEMWHAFDAELLERFISRDRPVELLVKLLKWFLFDDTFHGYNAEWSMTDMYQSDQVVQQIIDKLSAWQKTEEYGRLPKKEQIDVGAMIILLDNHYVNRLKPSIWGNNRMVVTEDVIRDVGFIE